MITVCIATAVSLIRQGLLSVLTEKRGILVTSVLTHGDQLMTACRGDCDAVLLLDAALPGLNTEVVLRRFSQQARRVSVLLFGSFADYQAAQINRLRISGILSINDDTEEFVRAVHRAAEKEFFLSTRMRRQQESAAPADPTVREGIEAILTYTELHVFHALAENLTSREIAEKMFISHRTVQKHRANIARKLKLEGNNTLLAFALRYHAGGQ